VGIHGPEAGGASVDSERRIYGEASGDAPLRRGRRSEGHGLRGFFPFCLTDQEDKAGRGGAATRKNFPFLSGKCGGSHVSVRESAQESRM
jgi:hypothetical protein